MATVGVVGSSSCLAFICLFCRLTMSHGLFLHRTHPIVKHVHVLNRTSGLVSEERGYSTRLVLRLDGLGFHPDMELKFTADKLQRGEECSSNVLEKIEYNHQFVNSTSTVFYMRLITDKSHLYTCVKAVYRTDSVNKSEQFNTLPNEVIKWLHQGDDGLILLDPDPLDKSRHLSNSLRAEARGSIDLKWRSDARRSVDQPLGDDPLATGLGLNRLDQESPRIAEMQQTNSQGSRAPLLRNNVLDGEGLSLFGVRLESSESQWSLDEVDGTPVLLMGSTVVLRVFGSGFTSTTFLILTDRAGIRGNHCEFPTGTTAQVMLEFKSNVGIVKITIPEVGVPETRYYFCYKSESNTTGHWTHFGSAKYQSIKTYSKVLPLWVSCIIILVCLTFSSLFSGLNLGLMSLDQTDLKIIANTGTEQERKYAQAIKPVRQHGNYLLCSILLGNVMVNSTFTILLDSLTSGIVAIVASTLLIVIFGEITPQAICSRHGLAVGAKTILITKMVMGITFPLSYPISKILDKILGEEIGAVFTRERLKELVKLNTGSNIKTDELNIISGVLELTEKKVCDVMTRIEDVFMLSTDTVLDFETVSSIMKSGFSRIPVYDGQRTNTVTVLYIKDLALVDPDDNLPIKTVCEFYQNNCYFIFEDTPLDIIFKQFKEGSQGHMAIVHRVNNEGEGDPFYETVGIVTLEDVIEEIIQSEIVDETDVYTDNKSKRRRQQKYKDFSEFAEMSENQKVHISPQLTLATFQFLTTSVEAFKVENISENVLKRVLKQNVFFHIRIKNKDTMKKDPATIIYDQGKPADYFVLILEGRVEVRVGRENLMFESGPFTYFGTQALLQNVGVADCVVESPSGGGVSLAVTGGSGGGSSMLGSLQSVIQVDSKQRHTFIPDYSVRAVTEVFYVKLPRSLYLAAKRATLMQLSRKAGEESTSNVDTLDDVFEKLIHNMEDESKSQGTPEVTRTSSQVSPRGSPLNNGGLVLTSSEPVLPTSQASGDKDMQEECAKLLLNQ